MNLLIVGSQGQLGTDLLRLARERAVPVTGLGRSELDLGDPDRITDALAGYDFDILINCAARHGTDEIEGDPAAAFRINGHAVERLALTCRERGARFVQVSTDYVFRGDATRPYSEADPPGPVSLYGASKLFGESLAMRAHPDKTLVVRTASLFGVAAAEKGGGNFVETVLAAARDGRPLRVVDDIVMSPTGTADLAEGILSLLSSGDTAGLYHLVNAGQASWYAFACAILEEGGMDGSVTPVSAAEQPTPARRPSFSVLATDRARERGVILPEWRAALRAYLAARPGGEKDAAGEST